MAIDRKKSYSFSKRYRFISILDMLASQPTSYPNEARMLSGYRFLHISAYFDTAVNTADYR